MTPTALLALTAHARSASTRKHTASAAPATQAPRDKQSCVPRMLRIIAALAATLVLIVSLVDPLRGSDRLDATDATYDQGVRHE